MDRPQVTHMLARLGSRSAAMLVVVTVSGLAVGALLHVAGAGDAGNDACARLFTC
jgi:hypothetical protein